jgi:hypothetical protein
MISREVSGRRPARGQAPSRVDDIGFSLPFFDCGGTGRDSYPLAIVGGGLILDSGEAEATFVYRCQDRYLTYTSLLGLRSVFFVSDDAHACWYAAQLERVRASYSTIATFCDVLSPELPIEPLYVECDLKTMRLTGSSGFQRQVSTMLESGRTTIRFVLNQLSPTYAKLVVQLEGLLRAAGAKPIFDHHWCDECARLAMLFHNKAAYVRLVRESDRSLLPPHVETGLITASEVMGLHNWPDILRLYLERSGAIEEPDSIFIKSDQDSSGNVAARLERHDFAAALGPLKAEIARSILGEGVGTISDLGELQSEIALAPSLERHIFSSDELAELRRCQAARRHHVGLLIQRGLRSCPDGRGRFHGVGFSYLIRGIDDVVPIVVAAQIYKDPDRRQYLGSFISDEVARDTLSFGLGEQMLNLCRRFAERGYRGPINFDAVEDERGEYRLVYDCNPRLTAIFPPWAVRRALRQAHFDAETILSLGYRGEFACSELYRLLVRLDYNRLLFTRSQQSGIILVPNLAQRHGLDVFFVNVSLSKAQRMLAFVNEIVGRPSTASRIYF